ncbi:MAG TPA: ThiF family adenylyltransferase [Candidatus Brocadiales bacterium]|nr:ThiF family adenylyltransferase [Candidatus Brocadiales bacterium]
MTYHLSNRYSRQILFSRIGEEGQKHLKRSFAIILGCGALGSVSASLLTRAGVGRIKIIDRDFIEENNLQRQILFDEEDIKKGLPKAIAAQEKLRKINSSVVVEGVVSDVNYTNIEKILDGADVVIDGLDNFETRFLLNDYCVKNKTPWIYGACIGSTGLTMNIVPQKTPCLRCVLESLPPRGTLPTCDTAGIIGSIAMVIASIQATEAIKLLTKNIDAMSKDLVKFDIWEGKIQKVRVSSATNECPTCQQGNYEFLNASQGSWTTTICGRNGVQIINQGRGERPFAPTNGLQFEQLAQKLRPLGEVGFNKYMMKFKIDSYEMTIFPDGRAIITGTNDPSIAKGLYAKYIGM